MNLCPWILLPRRSIAVTFAILVATAASKAEQIRFSKPAQEIPAPYKPEENLPETQSKRPNFSAPGVAAPVMPQQTIIHIQPRYEDEDDRLSTRASRHSSDPRRDPRPGRDSVTGQNSLTPREAFPGELWR